MFFVGSVCSVGWLANLGDLGRYIPVLATYVASMYALKKENSYRYYGFIFFTDVEM